MRSGREVKNVIRDDGDREIGLGCVIEKESALGRKIMCVKVRI